MIVVGGTLRIAVFRPAAMPIKMNRPVICWEIPADVWAGLIEPLVSSSDESVQTLISESLFSGCFEL